MICGGIHHPLSLVAQQFGFVGWICRANMYDLLFRARPPFRRRPSRILPSLSPRAPTVDVLTFPVVVDISVALTYPCLHSRRSARFISPAFMYVRYQSALSPQARLSCAPLRVGSYRMFFLLLSVFTRNTMPDQPHRRTAFENPATGWRRLASPFSARTTRRTG